MSWNGIYKLTPQKPKPKSEQDLDSSSEFLVWDMEFKSKHLSNESSDTLSQNISSNNPPLSQPLNTIK